MAFIDIDSNDPVVNATFYNVNEAVGFGCKNSVEDVKVVQFFLKRVYTGIEMNRELKPWGDMVVDGKCGPITRAWITKYQSDLRRFGGSCMVDGIIDKAGNEINSNNLQGLYSQTKYTIRFLNTTLRKHDSDVYKNLTTHPAVPADVKLIFLQIQAQGPPMNFGTPESA